MQRALEAWAAIFSSENGLISTQRTRVSKTVSGR
jgi:hypothetical protein